MLTGVHIGAYGRDGDGGEPVVDLWGLVARILSETGVPRLRLSSIEPWDLPQRAFSLWENTRLCRHLHLPLQSGSDAVLQRMARRCRKNDFAAVVEAARAAIPGLALTTDVIVGFPGETDDEFAESLAFARDMEFARAHVFPYSLAPWDAGGGDARSGTGAGQAPAGQGHAHCGFRFGPGFPPAVCRPNDEGSVGVIKSRGSGACVERANGQLFAGTNGQRC